ncbi:MAG: prepilin-type N-terminal cleavage/methylation domain-containing protein [Pirellulaceae bacterium]|jgi:prepilin-type N-terminal cleavage/methylation domain-containing protein
MVVSLEGQPMVLRSLLPKSRRAFTLVEVLIVVLIMAVVSAAAVKSFQLSTADANVASLTQTFRRIEEAASRYRIRNGNWPATTNKHSAPGDFTGYLDESAFTHAAPGTVNSRGTVVFYNNAHGVFVGVTQLDTGVAETIDSQYDDGVANTGRIRVSASGGTTQMLYVIVDLNGSGTSTTVGK